MEKIKKVSRSFRILFQVLFYMIPLLVLWFWVVFHGRYDIFSPLGMGTRFMAGPVTVNLLTRVLGFIASMLPVGIIMYGLRQLIKLFSNYEAGKIFTLANANRYRKLGYTLFAWVIGDIIYSGLITVILTFQNPPHHRLAAISFTGVDIDALITGGIILLIAWVMQEAHKISAEQTLTI